MYRFVSIDIIALILAFVNKNNTEKTGKILVCFMDSAQVPAACRFVRKNFIKRRYLVDKFGAYGKMVLVVVFVIMTEKTWIL